MVEAGAVMYVKLSVNNRQLSLWLFFLFDSSHHLKSMRRDGHR